MTVTKGHLVNSVHNHLGMPKNKSVDLIESLLEIMKKTLENDEDILISGFGKFCVRGKKERKGRNPQNDRKLVLSARRVIVFKCSGRLKDKVNDG